MLFTWGSQGPDWMTLSIQKQPVTDIGRYASIGLRPKICLPFGPKKGLFMQFLSCQASFTKSAPMSIQSLACYVRLCLCPFLETPLPSELKISDRRVHCLYWLTRWWFFLGFFGQGRVCGSGCCSKWHVSSVRLQVTGDAWHVEHDMSNMGKWNFGGKGFCYFFLFLNLSVTSVTLFCLEVWAPAKGTIVKFQ